MPLAFAPSGYAAFMTPNSLMMGGGQIMQSNVGGFGDYIGQQMGPQMDSYVGQSMGQQIMPTMAGLRPYTAGMNAGGVADRGGYRSIVQQIPLSQQEMSQVQPPPRAMDNTARSPSNRHLRHENEELRNQNAAMGNQITQLKKDVEGLKSQLQNLVRQNETQNGSSSPMPTPLATPPRPTSTSTPKRAQTPVSSGDENLRGGSGNFSTQILQASPSASYNGRFPSASRSNNSLATSRSGAFSSGVRPGWKMTSAHNPPLSIGAQFRQLSGPNGCITLGITRLAIGGPAECAGLQTGDILEECEFKILDEKNPQNFIMRRLSGCGFSKNALQKMLNTLKAGEEVRFAVNREGERFEVMVSLIPIDQCEWSAESEAMLDRSFTPTDDGLNEIPVMAEFSEFELSMDGKPRSHRWEVNWELNFDTFMRFCVKEAKLHVGDDFVNNEEAMTKFEDACRACELQLIKEGHGDVRISSLWNNRDLILHITGQQCEDQGLLNASF